MRARGMLSWFLLIGVILFSTPCRAETLLLDDGTVVSGKMISTTDTTVVFKGDDGAQASYDKEKIIYIGLKDWVALRAKGIKGDTYYSFVDKCKFLLPPRTWHVEFEKPKLGIDGTILEISQEASESYAVLAMERWEGDLDDYVNGLKSVWEKNLGPGYKLLSVKETTVGNLPARSAIFTAKIEGNQISYKATVLLGNKNAYRLVAWTQAGNFPQIEKEFDKMAQSFSLLGAGKSP